MKSDNTITGWQFTATKWHSETDKEKFARHYIRFVQARCPRAKFHEWFYQRLMQMFMHIAHYNRFGFYEIWCENAEKRFAFLRHHATFDCVGDPAWTWSDVEQTLRTWLNESGILREYEIEARVARRNETISIVKAAMRDLTEDDLTQLLRERNALIESSMVERGNGIELQTGLRAEQQALFRI